MIFVFLSFPFKASWYSIRFLMTGFLNKITFIKTSSIQLLWFLDIKFESRTVAPITYAIYFFLFFPLFSFFLFTMFFFVFIGSSVLRFFDLFNFETSKHKARRAREFISHWIVVQPPIFQFESHQEQTNQILLQLHLLYLVSSWLPDF